ncbi:hypothetical protein NL676_013264 [Syzygium grande]|nr:hypothetical protein NL676_013264 [Syzygium grande]
MQEFQLNGLQLPHVRELLVERCVPLQRFRLSSMRKLKDVLTVGKVDVSSTKLPYHCHIRISSCGKDFWGSLDAFKHHKVTAKVQEEELENEALRFLSLYGNHGRRKGGDEVERPNPYTLFLLSLF